MNHALFLFLNLLLTLVEAIALYLFVGSFYNCKLHGKILYLYFVSLIIADVTIYYLLEDITYAKLFMLVVVDSVWILIGFRPHFVISITVAVFFVAFLAIGDSIFLMGFHAISGQDAQVYLSNPYAYYAFCYFIKMFELLLITSLRQFIKSRTDFQSSTWQDWIKTTMFPIMSVIIAIFLMQIYLADNNVAIPILTCSIALIITDILAIILLNYIEQQQQKLQDYSILQYSYKQEQDNLAAWMNAYTNQRKQTHEFQNQLNVIRGLAQAENRTDLWYYLSGRAGEKGGVVYGSGPHAI